MHAQRRPFLQQALANLDRRRHADIVRVLLERQTQHADGFILQNPQRIGDLFQESIHLSCVDFLHFFQQSKIVAKVVADADESAQVFRETTPAKAKRRVEEPAANVRNLHREERVGGVLD